MDISPKTVKELRERTGAGMMDCKKALQESDGVIEEAEKLLRKLDKAKASKKSGRSAKQGLIYSYIHPGDRLGVLVEINCETDFAAAAVEFRELVKDIAMHVAAADPQFIGSGDVTEDVLDAEREIIRAQVEAMGKPPEIAEKIVAGKIKSFTAEICLLDQQFVKDPAVTVCERIEATIGKIGENVRVRRFVRFKLGDDAAIATASTPAPEA